MANINTFVTSEMVLELSKVVVQGLEHLGNAIPIELSRKLIANTVKITLYPDASVPPDPEINAIHNIKVNQSESAIVTLFALATKHCLNSTKLRALLETYSITEQAIQILIKCFEDNQKEFFVKQLEMAHTFQHITDVEWKILSDVKSSTSDRSSEELTFQVNFGNYQPNTGQRDTIVEFLCNTAELQSLLSKFKEIERHCESVANK